MSNSTETFIRESVNRFLEKIIWQASLANRKRSSIDILSINLKDKASFLDVFEKVLNLFTKKNYKWQIDRKDDIVPYEESLRRLFVLLLIVTFINLMTSTIMALIVASVFEKGEERMLVYVNDTKSMYVT